MGFLIMLYGPSVISLSAFVLLLLVFPPMYATDDNLIISPKATRNNEVTTVR
ncbi:MAG: hypothetical protein U9R01_02120 [candidate division WOR-3 bacterium]|nr:hypothetical protein [candidate division WOR-3 bacterium]